MRLAIEAGNGILVPWMLLSPLRFPLSKLPSRFPPAVDGVLGRELPLVLGRDPPPKRLVRPPPTRSLRNDMITDGCNRSQ